MTRDRPGWRLNAGALVFRQRIASSASDLISQGLGDGPRYRADRFRQVDDPYATVNELNVPTRNTITVEDPIEYRVAGIKQTQVNNRIGYTFASGLRSALRSDPDIILIGEIRDLETARIAAEAALTGHLVMSTLHDNDAASSTIRLIDMGLEPFLVTPPWNASSPRDCFRRLCRRCRAEGPASSEELLELNAMSLIQGRTPSEVSLYRAKGSHSADDKTHEAGVNGFRTNVRFQA